MKNDGSFTMSNTLNNLDTAFLQRLAAALGETQNINSIDACLTRLRISVENTNKVDQEQLKQLGAQGVVVLADCVQVIFGKESDAIKSRLQHWITNPSTTILAEKVLRAYGGKENIAELDACLTRLRVKINDLSRVDQEQLKELGAKGVVVIGTSVQSIFGPSSNTLKTQLETIIN